MCWADVSCTIARFFRVAGFIIVALHVNSVKILENPFPLIPFLNLLIQVLYTRGFKYLLLYI